jgi:hypothetical protein
MPEVFRVLVHYADQFGISVADGIEYQGKRWVVGRWLENKTEKYRTPERIICLDDLGCYSTPNSSKSDFALFAPLSKGVCEGTVPPASGSRYVVIERPDIRFPLRPGSIEPQT